MEMLDHRPVGICSAGDDLLGAAVAVTKRERDVVRAGGIRALDGEGRLGPDDLERLPFRRVERALDDRREPIAEVEPARERRADDAAPPRR